MSYWHNYPSATHYQGWEHEPIPGWGVRPVMAGPRMVGVGEISDVPFLCAAQQQLYATARKLYPGDDARQFAYILTNGPGFAGDWQVWCAQHPDVAAPAKGGSMTPVALSTSSMPWWVWVAVPVTLGGMYALAREMGWIGKAA